MIHLIKFERVVPPKKVVGKGDFDTYADSTYTGGNKKIPPEVERLFNHSDIDRVEYNDWFWIRTMPGFFKRKQAVQSSPLLACFEPHLKLLEGLEGKLVEVEKLVQVNLYMDGEEYEMYFSNSSRTEQGHLKKDLMIHALTPTQLPYDKMVETLSEPVTVARIEYEGVSNKQAI